MVVDEAVEVGIGLKKNCSNECLDIPGLRNTTFCLCGTICGKKEGKQFEKEIETIGLEE